MRMLVLWADALLRAALLLTGAADAESLDESVLTRLEVLQRHPLRLNQASRMRLLSGGILTPYQVASLEDYRHNAGDVLSLAELALVDGFGAQWTEIMAPFISLESSRAPGQRDTLVWGQTALVNADLKAVRAKYRISSERLMAGAAGRVDYDGNIAWTLHGEYFLPRGRIVAGDFNARYGQGLALWTSFRLSGLQTVDAFELRPGGIAPSWSASGEGTLRGIAGEWTPGNWTISAFGALGGTFGLSGRHLWRSAEAGVLVCRKPDGWLFSADGKGHIGRTTFFGEAAVGTGGAWAALGGCRIGLRESDRLVFQLRALPSRFSGKKYGEYAFAAGYGWRNASLTADYSLLPIPGGDTSRMQLKVYGRWEIGFKKGWTLVLRGYERWRSYERNRLDLRADLGWEKGCWSVKGRLNGLWCQGTGLLGYVEGGFKNEAWTLSLRGTMFRIDAWDDRIYVYEHDAPGNFSVPACYGRGGALSLFAGWKHRFYGKRKGLTLKCYGRAWGMMRKDRPFSPALRLQVQLDW